ncbi:hypothetical protein AVEN_209157-1 [Araneus ventricosus]|uniref:Uncharacterized protein n=1 Tax=Araneus ventricosus TaxID=182803 RepID=A0A4Y2S7F7_ARAVE|nr:hypothetical protein AVEN_209157-1 [Araneus ventricosus]
MDAESLKKVRMPVRKAATELIKHLEKEFDKKEAQYLDLIGEIVANCRFFEKVNLMPDSRAEEILPACLQKNSSGSLE